jgi:hypothetical protein
MQRLFKPFISICLLFLLGSLFSCDDGCKKDYTYYNEYNLGFMVFDERTGENLLEIGVNRYRQDTVQIFNEDLEPLGIHPTQSGELILYFMYYARERVGVEPLNTPLAHTYYVYFEEGDYDTLQISYQIGLDPCDDRILTQWSAYYNDSLYVNHTSDPPTGAWINIVKNSSGGK